VGQALGNANIVGFSFSGNFAFGLAMLIDNFLLLRVNVGRKFGDLLPLIVDVWECVESLYPQDNALKESLRALHRLFTPKELKWQAVNLC
jgi:hypothetical protein